MITASNGFSWISGDSDLLGAGTVMAIVLPVYYTLRESGLDALPRMDEWYGRFRRRQIITPTME